MFKKKGQKVNRQYQEISNKVEICLSMDLSYIYEMKWSYFLSKLFSLHMHLVAYGPYWKHVAEFWQKRKSPNMIFITYEGLQKVSCYFSIEI